MLKELTILIPTYNRPQKLRRFLLYTVISYPGNELVFSKIRIKIADGSLSEDSSCNILIENLSRMGVAIEYSRLPGESLVRRLMLAVNSVDTKYVMTCGDDDLIDFQGLSTWLSEKFLTKKIYPIVAGLRISLDYHFLVYFAVVQSVHIMDLK